MQFFELQSGVLFVGPPRLLTSRLVVLEREDKTVNNGENVKHSYHTVILSFYTYTPSPRTLTYFIPFLLSYLSSSHPLPTTHFPIALYDFPYIYLSYIHIYLSLQLFLYPLYASGWITSWFQVLDLAKPVSRRVSVGKRGDEISYYFSLLSL